MKKAALIVLALFVVLLLSLLGGSMVWVLDGVDRLDIDGTAAVVDRPRESITQGKGWAHYGGDAGGHRYSSLAEITPENVQDLEVAWLYRTGDLDARPEAMRRSATEAVVLRQPMA